MCQAFWQSLLLRIEHCSTVGDEEGIVGIPETFSADEAIMIMNKE